MELKVTIHRGGGSLESGGSGDDLDQLPGDDSLSGPVEGDGQLVNHLT